jgi:hypothetical protein
LPSHIHKIWKACSERLIQGCGHFASSYASNVLVLDLYSPSAAPANHSHSISHHHTIRQSFPVGLAAAHWAKNTRSFLLPFCPPRSGAAPKGTVGDKPSKWITVADDSGISATRFERTSLVATISKFRIRLLLVIRLKGRFFPRSRFLFSGSRFGPRNYNN